MSDVWDSANEATVAPKFYFGQVFTDAFFCVLQKGVGKVIFDPAQHAADRKLTCIKIDGQVTRADGNTYEITRDLIAEFRDWAGIVLPSLKVAGVHPRDLNERWAKWQMVETGRTWVDRTSGETKKGTTFKFLEFYPDEAACRTAETAHYSRPAENEGDDLDDTHPMPEEAPAPAAGNDARREQMAKFLPLLWAQAKGDVVKFEELIKSNDELKNLFPMDSPEVVAVVTRGGVPA